jgi:uncharacterized 2Fe-2S/4Fe-4S cluster protein (DUF4445 family)
MHHLLARLPVNTLAVRPFQPFQRAAIRDATDLMGGIFPEGAVVSLPPLIGGFVGSDALACLVYFGFEHAKAPMAAIDLGTNGEVMVTDGKRVLVASTAAGPAFEGVFISCGTRAVDGAIVAARVVDHQILFDTIADEAPVGLTGSGLISLVHALREVDVIEPNGRFSPKKNPFTERIGVDIHGGKRFSLTSDGRLGLTQWDIRELQKAKGAIRAAFETLMSRLDLAPQDLERVFLTGSFGGQIDIQSAVGIGMLPPVRREVVETVANGAGYGAALFLNDEGFRRGEELADKAEQIDLDRDEKFIARYIQAMSLDNAPLSN